MATGTEIYEAFPRKYRPRTWSDLVGQSHAVRVLRRSIVDDRIFHSYIFAGTAGSGKTSAARIFAMSLNCEGELGEYPALNDGSPCLRCTPCIEGLKGRNSDILEMDGASHGNVEDIRDLKERAVYSPMGKRRVFIIDEVHALSSSAFQALLKLLEEPPAHVVFVLATTDPEKIPATIQSRSITLEFRRHTEADILSRLSYVGEKEGIITDESSLALISRFADGSLRDSLTVLDQLNTSHPGEAITADLVSQVLGIISSTELADLMRAVIGRDAPALEERVMGILERTTEFASITRALTDWYRDVLRTKYGAIGYARRTESESALLNTFAENMELQAIDQAIKITWEMSERVRFSSSNPRTFFLTGLYRLMLLQEQTLVSLPPQADAQELPSHVEEVKPAVEAMSTSSLEEELRRLSG